MSEVVVPRAAGSGLLAGPAVPAGLLLLGSVSTLFGLAWDLQWHSDVGPDTFFTLPHLFIYAGSALAGLVSLAVVLTATAAVRAGRAVDTGIGGRRIAVFGVFQAPVGYLVSGVGSAIFLVYGLWDEWWHGLYGFDAVIASPPHVGLLTACVIAMMGSVMTCAAAAGERWAEPALIGSATVLLTFSMVAVVSVPASGVVDGQTVVVTLVSITVLATLATFTSGLRGALATGLAMVVMQVVLAFYAPWATALYAASEGLPIRDYTDGKPEMAMIMPSTLLLAVGALWLASRLTGGWITRTYVLGGALGGALLSATTPWQQVVLVSGQPLVDGAAQVVATIAAGALLGAAGGLLGRRFGDALRLLAQGSPAPAAGEAR